MLNCVSLIGRLVGDPVVKTLDDGIKVSNIRLAVMRPFKNPSGEYDVDFISVSLWYGTAMITEQYCSKGDLIYVKGRLVNKLQTINEKNYQFLEVVGERVIFLDHRSKQNEPITEDLLEPKEDD